MKNKTYGYDFVYSLTDKIAENNYVYRASQAELTELKLLSQSKTTYIRSEVADILGYIDNCGIAEEILLEMLSDKDWLVRANVAESLGGKATNEKTLEKLIEQINKDNHITAMVYMIIAVSDIVIACRFDKEKYINALLGIKLRQNYYELQHACVWSLCRLGETQYFVEYEKDIKSKNLYKVRSVLTKLRNLLECEIESKKFILADKIIELAKTVPHTTDKKHWYVNEILNTIFELAQTKNN